MKRNLHNLVLTVVLILAYYLIVENYADIIAEKYRWGGELNLLVLPFVFGLVACYLFRGLAIARVLLVSLIPTVALIPKLIEGGDPAKPGLEYLVYFAIIVSFSVGAFTEVGAYYLCKRMKHSRAQ